MPGHFNTAPSDAGGFASTSSNLEVGFFVTNDSPDKAPGDTAAGAGLYGQTKSLGAAGVFGASDAPFSVGVQGNGVDAGISGFSKAGAGARGFSLGSASFGVFGSNDATDPPPANSAGGAGVFGQTHVPGAAGVFGASQTAKGVGVQGNGPDAGVSGFSPAGDGVRGFTNRGSAAAGVHGAMLSPNGTGAGVVGESVGGAGVFGRASTEAGVIGFHGDPALQETTVGNDGAKAGVFGASDIGSGVVGYARSDAVEAIAAFGGFKSLAMGKPLAGHFVGDLQVDGDIFLPGADCAEQFDVINAAEVEAGTVLVIDGGGQLAPSTQAYDHRVAGVVSGAGAYRPGIVLDRRRSGAGRLPIALIGKVFCKVDAGYGPIDAGDLLTTSPTPGHAMRAADPAKAFGSVIGKALCRWPSGAGLVPILVTLR